MTETSSVLGEGRQMPSFELPDEEGRHRKLLEYLDKGPVILVFFRGDWWPYCNGQLVSYARSYDEFRKRGFKVVGISVEPPSRNAAMAEKLDLPFPLLSDPRGELIERVGLWSEEEGVSMPAVVLLDKSGTVRYLYSGGTDFSDRPTKKSLLEILDRVSPDGEAGESGPEVRVTAEEADNATVRPDKPAMTLEQLRPYYLGAYYATIAMQKKLEDSGPEGKVSYKKVSDYQELINEYSEALQETAQT